MSGAVGLFRRDGSQVQNGNIQAMLAKLLHRGPDGNKTWADGPIGFGHAMLWTTPESIDELLPHYECSTGLGITADARIDNREELISALGIRGRVSEISDSALILRAYEKWGVACPRMLLGDFVFAIWDKREQRLLCARDPMGIKCLYFFASEGLFAFASEIKALCSLPEVPSRLNELRVLDYLANIIEDRSITFYKNIERLPAASVLTVTRDRVRMESYWDLDVSKELKLSSDEEYADAFRESFTKSVKARMRSAFPVASALSGGLDSSSIACLARNLHRDSGKATPIRTYSLIFPSLPEKQLGQIDERNYMHDVLSQGGFDPTFVSADKLSPLLDVEKVQQDLDEAYFQGNLYLHRAMYQAASKQGDRVFLDGLDGDTTVSHGFDYLADLVMGWRWMTLGKEVQSLANQMQTTPKRIVREFCVKPFCPTWVYTAWRRIHGRPADAGALQTFLSPEFAKRLRLEERINSLIQTSRLCFVTAREKHRAMIMYPLYAHALEAADKLSAAFGIEARYPFFDRRLIELCVSLPAGQKLSKGWTRSILRRAMAGILPETVQWRQSKANLSPNFYMRLVDQDNNAVSETLMKKSDHLEPYVDLKSIREAYRQCQANPLRSHDYSLNIFAAVNLGIWLQTAGVRP